MKKRDPARVLRAVIELNRSMYESMGTPMQITPPTLLLAVKVGNGATVTEIGEMFGVDLKTASRVLKVVRARGWATCEIDPQDERVRRLRLTPAGEKVALMLCRNIVDLAFSIAADSPDPSAGVRAKVIKHAKVLLGAAAVSLHVAGGMLLPAFMAVAAGEDMDLTTNDADSDGSIGATSLLL